MSAEVLVLEVLRRYPLANGCRDSAALTREQHLAQLSTSSPQILRWNHGSADDVPRWVQAIAPDAPADQTVLFVGEGSGAIVARRAIEPPTTVAESNTLPYLARPSGPGAVSAVRKLGGVLIAALLPAPTAPSASFAPRPEAVREVRPECLHAMLPRATLFGVANVGPVLMVLLRCRNTNDEVPQRGADAAAQAAELCLRRD